MAIQLKSSPVVQLPLPPHVVLPPTGIVYAVLASVLFAAGIAVLILLMRRLLRRDTGAVSDDWAEPAPGTDNASAFMAASMQGVISKLRAQENELARLHQLAQERAQESERLTEEVTRNMPTGLLLVSATGAITSTNPAAEETLGVHPLRYRAYKEILGGEDSELAQLLTACLHEGKTFHRGEVEHQTPYGEVRRLGVTISPIYRFPRTGQAHPAASSTKPWGQPAPPGAKVSGALCLMSDLTELAALQKQIRWKENLAALGEMSAGIAHEFKNALATISGYAQMIRSDTKSGDTRDSAERILDQTKALTHVVTEFLRFAKPLEISYETVAMDALIDRLAQETREALPDSTVHLGGKFIEVPGDEALLRQALINLTRNAIEAAREAGRAPEVTISGSIEHLGNREWQRICVSDNGSGIPEIDLPKIFLPFYTTKAEGTGLGLAVVQKVALQHGGSIEARNRTDNGNSGGAEFLLWLPLRQEPSPSLFPPQAARI